MNLTQYNTKLKESGKKYIFEDWKCRSSQIGNIMSNLESITQKQLEKLQELQDRKNDKSAKPLTANMEAELKELIAKRDAPDELPTGAITWLDAEFRRVFWGRERMLFNKYLEKGNIMEEDALQLVSDIDGKFYAKNQEKLQNKYTIGTPDHVSDFVIDTKCSWDFDTYDAAKLTSLYEWQIKDYCWMAGLDKGILAYCLVNSTENQVINAIKSLWYQMGCPDQEGEKWLEAAMLCERNMIFDKKAFKRDSPNYDFENFDDITIPAIFRVKKFEVALEESDKKYMISRVLLARKYLLEKEIETVEKLKL